MAKGLRGAHRQSGEKVVFAANALVVISASIITASLALILEDLIPRSKADGFIVPWRWAVGISALVMLVGALVWRARVHRKRGTLFYVQMLDEAMPNWHEQPLAAARSRRMSMRSVTRWADLGQRTRGGVIDVVEPCREIGAALEEAINSDRDDTGYTVAPNTLWPVALSLGTYLPHAEDLRLLELLPNAGETEFPLIACSRIRATSAKQDLAEGTPQGRVGVWLAFTPAAQHLSAQDFRTFGVETLHTITYQGKMPGKQYSPELTADDMAHLGSEIAEHLERIKNDAGERELVVVAMAPKTVMLSVGWHLAQRECRFFHNTHFMHRDQDSKTYIPMRVRDSQPTTPPRPCEQEDLGARQAETDVLTARGNGHKTETNGAGDGPAHP